jgi:tetratricopeptide (TPR) repeat protein
VATVLTDTKAAFDAGRWKQAARGYSQLKSIFSRHPDLAAAAGGGKGADAAILLILRMFVIAQSRAGQHRRAVRSYVEVAELSERRGEIAELEYEWEGAARESMALGRWADAEQFARRAVEAGRRHDDATDLARALSVLGETLLGQRLLIECQAALKESLDTLAASDEDADVDRAVTLEKLARAATEARDRAAAVHWIDAGALLSGLQPQMARPRHGSMIA